MLGVRLKDEIQSRPKRWGEELKMTVSYLKNSSNQVDYSIDVDMLTDMAEN